nr:MAG TPA: hypothetical protein [Bacteriophage sp.]
MLILKLILTIDNFDKKLINLHKQDILFPY